MMADGEVRCPECGSNELTTIRKDIEEKKSVAESIIGAVFAVFAGAIGLLGGTIGSKNPTFTCTKCGHQFQPRLSRTD
jgi:predicted RNA-binding Zn-ribbon protein involved in translation (DUF1610 family)